ncbi:MAG: hypothetical protein IIA63_06915 [Nitrospinae bacterium]|nr:hypothetical protein [Nitrospinota bacterium]
MKTNRKLNGILAVALLALVLMGPSMATSKDDAASKDAAPKTPLPKMMPRPGQRRHPNRSKWRR